MKALKLRRFMYLRRKPIATLTLVLVSVSMLSTATATILHGFYRCCTAYLGEGDDIIALYDRGSSTPFTGLIPSRIADELTSIDGVLAFSMEVLAPSILEGEPVIVRGVHLEDLLKLNDIEILDGSKPSSDEPAYALIGCRAASRLKVKPGARLIALGVLSDRYVELRVEAVYSSDTALDDEVIASMDTGRWLRGVGYDYATLIRVRIDRAKLTLDTLTRELSSRVGIEGGPGGGGPPRPTLKYSYIATASGSIGVSTVEGFMERYLESYGLTGWSITLLSISTILFASLTIVEAFRMVVERHGAELSILRSLGLSRLDLKIDMILKLTPYIMLSSLIGSASALALVEALRSYGLLRILSYTVSVGFDPATLTVSIASTMLLAIISIAWRDM
ncbi:MAG: hypothetical protein QXQ29_00190 [Candidatus Bathyarchaeia archaeon]